MENIELTKMAAYAYNAIPEEDKVDLYNTYAEKIGAELIYPMEYFNEIMGEYLPEQVADMCFYGSYNPTHNWFTFDGYGNVNTFYSVDSLLSEEGWEEVLGDLAPEDLPDSLKEVLED